MMACAFLLTSCADAPEGEKAETSDARQIDGQATGSSYTVDPAQSKLEWIGTKPTGQHHGTFQIKEGQLSVSENNITGGRFTIDIQSVQPDDQDEEYNTKLQQHLLSEDFFEADRFPEGVFEIAAVVPIPDDQAGDGAAVMEQATHTVTGNLTLKDETKSITFPAVVNISGNQVTADASFNINRTDWNMTYRSDNSLGDKLIHQEVNIKIHLVANAEGA